MGEGVRLFFSIFTADGLAWLRHAMGPDKAEPQINGIFRSTTMPRAMRKLVATLAQASGQERQASVLRVVGSAHNRGFLEVG